MVLQLGLQVVIEKEVDDHCQIEGQRAQNVGDDHCNGQLEGFDLGFGQGLDRPVLSDRHVGHDRVEAAVFRHSLLARVANLQVGWRVG